jgi:hypothetical protein
MGKGSKNKKIVAAPGADASSAAAGADAAGAGAVATGVAAADVAAKAAAADVKAAPKRAVKTAAAAKAAATAADADTTAATAAKATAVADVKVAVADGAAPAKADDETAAVKTTPEVASVIAKAIAAMKAAIAPKATSEIAAKAAPKRAAKPAVAAKAKRNKSLADDDALSRADEMFKKRRDLRDGLIALTVLIAIIAAPAVGAAVQAHEQSGNAATVEGEPAEITQVAEKEEAFVPLVVNAVKTGDTALTGTGNPGFIVRVLFVGQEDPSEATVSKNGTWTLVAPSGVSLKAGDEKVLDITQNDPKTSDSYRPGATTPTKPETKADPVVTEEPEPATETPEESAPEPVWHEPWSEQVLVRAAWTERIPHPAEYTTVHYDAVYGPDPETGEWVELEPARDVPELVRDAWTEEIYHPAEYRTDYYDGYWGE